MQTDTLVRSARRTLQALVGLIGVAVIFEAMRATGLLPASGVPSSANIGGALVRSIADGGLPSALGSTAVAWLLGLLVAAVLGIPVGVAVGRSSWADSTLERAIEFLRPLPVVALVPAAIVLFGIQIGMQVFLIALACVWPVLLGTRGGVRAVDPLQADTARAFGYGRAAVARRVYLPSAVPAIMTSVRVAASLGVVVAVAAELIAGSPGLGKLLIDSQSAGNNDVVWAVLVITGVFGVVVNVILAAIERSVAGWQELSTERSR